MKRIQLRLLPVTALIFAIIFSGGCAAQKKTPANDLPVFSNFVYKGNDKIYNDNPLKPDEFYSPILQGCYPDPAIMPQGR